MSRSKRLKRQLSIRDIQHKINELHDVYLPMDLNSAHYERKVVANKQLVYILTQSQRKDLIETDFEELLLCALTLVYYFGMGIKLRRRSYSKYMSYCSKLQFRKAESAFQKTMAALLPERSEMTIKITLYFFTTVELWPFENFVVQILEQVLYYNRGNTILYNIVLTDIHCVLFKDVKSARHRMRVFYDLLNSSNWIIDKNKLLPFVTRLLDLYAYSMNKADSGTGAYSYLRKGFELCLRRIFERVENDIRLMIITNMLNWFSMIKISLDDVLEFWMLLEHAAQHYQVGLYTQSFKEGLIQHVLKRLVGSKLSTISLVGCRLLQAFLDRQKNAQYLLELKIFFEFTQDAIKKGICNDADKMFIRYHRDILHDYLMSAIKNHCTSLVNLRMVFSIVCCVVLEVPCGLTAAAAAYFVMSVQDLALNGENIPAPCRYWLHAVVVSVMSLICWVHKAPVLYTYVNTIIARRAKEAPQLNPPMKYRYRIIRHQITWNKPSFFFEDWELRYALWKHFEDKKCRRALELHNTCPRSSNLFSQQKMLISWNNVPFLYLLYFSWS